MASCTYNPGVNSVNPYAVLEIREQSQDIASNSTTLWYELKIYRPSVIQSNVSKNYSITIDGTTVKSSTTTIGGSGTKTIASGTHTVYHSSDGSKNISFSFSLDFKLYWNGTYVGVGSANGSSSLTTIARATTPSLNPSDVTLGGTIQISLPRASSSFTHSVTWALGGLSGSLGSNLGTTATLQTSTSWASQFPSSNSATGQITCVTYNGGTVIGEKTVTFTVRISSGSEPIINSINISEATSGIYNKFYNYIQNKSTLSVSINASGQNGSSIVSYNTTICGATYSGRSFTSSPLTESGYVTISASVTDSRGMTATKTQQINVLAYSEPMVRKFSVERANSYGEPDAIGTYALIHLDYQISSLGSRNDSSCKIEYKRSTDSYWNTVETLYGYSFSGDKNGGSILSEAYTYDFRVVVSDYFGSFEVPYDNTPSAFTIFNVNKSGTSMCFGGVSQRTSEKCFDFNESVYFAKNVMPYANNGASLGTSSNKFSNVYATTGNFGSIYSNGRDIVQDVSNLSRDLSVSSGTWRPVAQQNMTITSYEGCNYYKIGRLVYVEGRINVTGGSQRTSNTFSGLPYEPSKSGQHVGITYCNCMADQGVVVGSMGLETYWNSVYDYGLKFFIWSDNRSWDGDSCLGANQSGTINFSGVYLAA